MSCESTAWSPGVLDAGTLLVVRELRMNDRGFQSDQCMQRDIFATSQGIAAILIRNAGSINAGQSSSTTTAFLGSDTSQSSRKGIAHTPNILATKLQHIRTSVQHN